MTLTVRQCLQMDVFRDVKLVAGVQGLDRIVRIANIAETPEVATWMKGGEFLITGGYLFKDSPQLRKELIFELEAKGVAVLGFRPGKYFEHVPEELIGYADEVGLPLLELPADIPYIDLMLPIFETVINNQYYALKKSESIHHALLDVVLAGRGIEGICVTLGELIKRPVLVINAAGNLLSDSKPADKHEDTIDAHIRNLMEHCRKNLKKLAALQPHIVHHVVVGTEKDSHSLIVVPVEVNNMISGYLVIEETDGPLDGQELIALERASTIFALELMKSYASFETEKQVRGELLDYLIHGNFSNNEAVIRWASNLNFDLLSKCVVFYVALDSFEDHLLQVEQPADDNVGVFKGMVYRAVSRCFSDYPGGSLTMVKSNCLIGLINIDTRKQDVWELLKRKLGRLLEELNLKLKKKLTVSIGVGRAFNGAGNVRCSYSEARSAFRIGNLLFGTASLVFFDELGAYVVLNELRDSTLAADFLENTLGSIFEHDKKLHSELFHTLEEYFKTNYNLKQTAEALFIHKNSLIYRLKKIESITGCDLNKGSDCFDLQLSVRLVQLLLSQGHALTR